MISPTTVMKLEYVSEIAFELNPFGNAFKVNDSDSSSALRRKTLETVVVLNTPSGFTTILFSTASLNSLDCESSLVVDVVPVAENRSLILPSTAGETKKDTESALLFETVIVLESPICTGASAVTSSAVIDTDMS